MLTDLDDADRLFTGGCPHADEDAEVCRFHVLPLEDVDCWMCIPLVNTDDDDAMEQYDNRLKIGRHDYHPLTACAECGHSYHLHRQQDRIASVGCGRVGCECLMFVPSCEKVYSYFPNPK